jgi:hypothetical protein
MRRVLSAMAASFLVVACSGSDFMATSVDEAGFETTDGHAPAVDASPGEDRGTAKLDAGAEWQADNAVPDATTDTAMLDVASIDRAADGVANTTPDGADAAPDQTIDAPSDTTCDAPIDFYRDRDKDGFGSTSEHVLACVPPADDAGAWVTQPGDCRDDLPNVKPFKTGSPDAPSYSGTGYSDPVRPRGTSFDYDCNGVETGDPTNTYQAGPPTCPALSGGNCNGSGYLAAVPARNGTGVNPFCGSTTIRICTANGLNCNPQDITTSAFRCR